MTAIAPGATLAPALHVPAPAATPLSVVYAVIAAALVLFCALTYLFGYAFVISFGVFGAFAGLAMIVGLTALDLMRQPKTRRPR